MKKFVLTIIVLAIGLNAMTAHKNYRAVPFSKATLLKSGDQKLYCSVCGMTLPMFYRTNHAADHDHIHDQYCSITCMIEDGVVNGKKLSNFRVVDNTTLKFIPSKDAYFVVGSKKPGTMSMVSKYAFASKEEAMEFASQFGGEVTDFAGALKAAKEGVAKDDKMIAKKQAMMAKKGQMIYTNKCQKIDDKFDSIAKAKAYIVSHKSCQGLNGKQLQAVGIYLFRR